MRRSIRGEVGMQGIRTRGNKGTRDGWGTLLVIRLFVERKLVHAQRRHSIPVDWNIVALEPVRLCPWWEIRAGEAATGGKRLLTAVWYCFLDGLPLTRIPTNRSA